MVTDAGLKRPQAAWVAFGARRPIWKNQSLRRCACLLGRSVTRLPLPSLFRGCEGRNSQSASFKGCRCEQSCPAPFCTQLHLDNTKVPERGILPLLNSVPHSRTAVADRGTRSQRPVAIWLGQHAGLASVTGEAPALAQAFLGSWSAEGSHDGLGLSCRRMRTASA